MSRRSPALGSRGVTLREVARAADVHVSTASRALDPEKAWRISAATVERVRSAADSLGYRPDMVARGLKHGRSLSVGVVVADLENPFNGPLIRGAVTALEAVGYVALVTETFDDSERLARVLDHLVGRRVDAIITTSTRASDKELLEGFAAHGTPVVLAVRSLSGSTLPTVCHDDELGATMVVDHLAELGHRVVAQLVGPPEIQSFADRSRGFARRAAEHGLVDVSSSVPVDSATTAAGRLATERLLGEASPRPTGLFAPNDLLAIGAIDAASSAGLECPRDISLVGYNDAPLVDHLSPPLTTVRIAAAEIGRLAAETALAAIHDPDRPPDCITLGATLVVRGSSGPAPA